MNRKQGIRLTVLIFWMTIIFAYSARPADISTQDSHFVGNLVADVVQGWSQAEWSETEQQIFVEHIDFYVRKAAHMAEYAVLGILLMRCLHSFGIMCPSLWKYALMAGILCAVSDEVHQYFVPGRACQLRDVMIDGTGVLIGIVVWKIKNECIVPFLENMVQY